MGTDRKGMWVTMVTRARSNSDSCHNKVLAAVRAIVAAKGENEFRVGEVQDYFEHQGIGGCTPQTIDTHIRSRCCANAPDNHAVTYAYFERVGRGLYRLLDGAV